MKLPTPRFLMLAGLCLSAPFIVSAQEGGNIGDDLTTSVTAGCFSVCQANQNIKGVQGGVTLTNILSSLFPLTVDVKMQCNGVDVAGAAQSLGNVDLAPFATGVLPYSIAFVPNSQCAYTLVATAINRNSPSRFETQTTAFTADCLDQPCGSAGCTLTQGYWKNHAEAWPVSTLTLGTQTYTKAQLLRVLTQPVKGNGLVSLAHQLIAAKLNLANGATCSVINQTIANADAQIGSLIVPPVGSGQLSTSSVGSLVTALDNFNNGLTATCAGHCAE